MFNQNESDATKQLLLASSIDVHFPLLTLNVNC